VPGRTIPHPRQLEAKRLGANVVPIKPGYPGRTIPHPRQLEAKRLGANVVPIKPGYLNVVEAHAREYCKKSGSGSGRWRQHCVVLGPMPSTTPSRWDAVDQR
jgi:hypothetical protein